MEEDDPNQAYPRFWNMQDFDARSEAWCHDERLLGLAGGLIDDEGLLYQSMVYFKPPGGRGQSHHQDQAYINKHPLVGVWVPLDKSDAEVGALSMLPGSHLHGLLPVSNDDATLSRSFTRGETVVEGREEREVLLDMEPGDAVFFDGRGTANFCTPRQARLCRPLTLATCATVLWTVVHGSYNNESAERWRRSFHLHVVGARTVDVEIPPHADPRQWEPEDSQLGASNCTPTASCLGPLVALRTHAPRACTGR